MSKYDIAFEEALNKLNKEQQEAVLKIDGPVMVVAGPGTGKTQILAARIGQILKQTDTSPENILCITYTNAGTVAMRNRLLQFIGPDAHRVCIETFHSFCNNIIQENFDRFGLGDLDMLSEIEEIELLHTLIDSLPKGHKLKRYGADPYYDTKRLKSLFAAIKSENWTSKLISERVDEYILKIQADKDNKDYFYVRDSKYGKAGEPKGKLKEEIKRMEDTRAAADLFNQYQQLMAKKSRYDFNDMIHWVIREFSSDDEFRLSYQERYQYILADEFQDTNDAQNALLNLLSKDVDKNPNLFVVGDDDQSIYRFQGANIENILGFSSEYAKNLKVIMLTQNYRSTQTVLDNAGQLIAFNSERIVSKPGFEEHTKKLLSANPERAIDASMPELCEYKDPVYEAADICKQIERIVAAGTKPSEIAIIYRKHKQANEMVRYFKHKGVAVNMKRRVDILQEPLTQKILNLLRYIVGEQSRAGSMDETLFQILHYDFIGIGNVEAIATFMARAKAEVKLKTLRSVIRDTDFKVDLFKPLDAWQESVKLLSANLDSWQMKLSNLTLQELFAHIITSSGCLYHAVHSAEKIFMLQQMNTLLDFIKRETAKHPGLKLKEFLKTIDLLISYGIGLPTERMDYSSEGITFTTAHGSKGLEFEYVYMLGCNKQAWDADGRSNEFRLPVTLFRSLPDDAGMEEKRRLFYVAMTRTKKHLHISYCTTESNGKELDVSQFVSELQGASGLEIQKKAAVYEDISEYEELVLRELALKPILPIEEPSVKLAVDHLKMSVTTLSSYLECPVQFFYTKILEVPSAKGAAQSFGIAVHHAYEKFFKAWQGKELFGDAEELKTYFRWSMKRHEEAFTAEDYKRRLEYGEQILQLHYDRFVGEWNKIYNVEYRMTAVIYNDIPLTGFIDKFEFDGLNATMVDYKTGKFRKEKFERPVADANPETEKKEHLYGGDYWRQAVFYRILMDNDQKKPKPWQFHHAEFDFIEPDKDSGEFKRQMVAVTDDDVATVGLQIKTVYDKIQNLNFEPGCGECAWCKLSGSSAK